jgi:PAS domain S-box-containing protein
MDKGMRVDGTDNNRILKKGKVLESNEAFLKAVVDSAVDGIITIDNRGHIISINPAGASLFGYTAEELLGQKINALMPSPHREGHDGYIQRYEKTKKARIIGIGRTVEGLKKDGTTFPFKLSVSEVPLEGEVVYTGIIHDVTAQFEAEARLKALNERLESIVDDRTNALNAAVDKLREINDSLQEEIGLRQKAESELQELLKKERELNEMKSRFVSLASHEFRTPLGAILSSASLIGRYDQESQQENRLKHVNRIRKAVGDLTTILDEFLSLDKLQTGKINADLREFELIGFIDEVAEEVSGICKENQRIDHIHTAEGIPVNQDYSILKNILLNLLSNAIKYSDQSSSITIRTTADPEMFRIAVHDRGIGIPKEDMKHMFERFFRARNATHIKGTGLGLNIVKRYLEVIGGTLEMESEEQVGSTFTVSVPRNMTN